MTRHAGIPLCGLVLGIALGACQTVSVGQAPATARIRPLFGPVIGTEVIAGRANDDEDEVLMLAGGAALVRVDLATARSTRVSLRVPPGEQCWDLARLAGGSLWTLQGRRMLARIERDGRVVEQIRLSDSHFGLFAVGARLVYQRADFTPPAPALQMGSPDGTRRTPWSAIATRPFPALARASAAALNMLSCGTAVARERPCWFPDEPAVWMVTDSGETRRVALPGLDVVSPEALLTSDNPHRPVRDAYSTKQGDLWVLSSGAPPAGSDAVVGGWLLARYGPTGAPLGAARLSDAARIILRADRSHVVLLLSSGMVGSVDAW